MLSHYSFSQLFLAFLFVALSLSVFAQTTDNNVAAMDEAKKATGAPKNWKRYDMFVVRKRGQNMAPPKIAPPKEFETTDKTVSNREAAAAAGPKETERYVPTIDDAINAENEAMKEEKKELQAEAQVKATGTGSRSTLGPNGNKEEANSAATESLVKNTNMNDAAPKTKSMTDNDAAMDNNAAPKTKSMTDNDAAMDNDDYGSTNEMDGKKTDGKEAAKTMETMKKLPGTDGETLPEKKEAATTATNTDSITDADKETTLTPTGDAEAHGNNVASAQTASKSNWQSIYAKFAETLIEKSNMPHTTINPTGLFSLLGLAMNGAKKESLQELSESWKLDKNHFTPEYVKMFNTDLAAMHFKVANTFFAPDPAKATTSDIFAKSGVTGILNDVKSVEAFMKEHTNGLFSKLTDFHTPSYEAFLNFQSFNFDWAATFQREEEHRHFDGGEHEQHQPKIQFVHAPGVNMRHVDGEKDFKAYELDVKANGKLVDDVKVYMISTTDKKLSYQRLIDIYGKVRKQTAHEVTFVFPPFHLIDVMKFDEKLFPHIYASPNTDFADLGQIAANENLGIKQKVDVCVDHKGIVGGSGIVLEKGLEKVTKERPFTAAFYFVVMDIKNEIPLFIGNVDNPKETGECSRS